MTRWLVPMLALGLLAACDEMSHQKRYDSDEASALFRDGKSLQAPPDGTIARDDPESAWAWALSIGDDSRRREAAAAALYGWKANGNREAAQAALNAAGFNDSDRQELMRKLQ